MSCGVINCKKPPRFPTKQNGGQVKNSEVLNLTLQLKLFQKLLSLLGLGDMVLLYPYE